MIAHNIPMNTRQMLHQTPKPPKIIAHRGASGWVPENTLAALQLAQKLNADYAEIDVRLTKDLIPVVLHDPSLKGVAPKQLIRNLTLQQTKKYEIGSWFDPKFSQELIPTLQEAIEICGPSLPLMVEIKREAHGPRTIAQKVFQTISETKQIWKNMVVGSFSHDIISTFQGMLTDSPLPITLQGIASKKADVTFFLHLGIKQLALSYKLITPALMHSLKEQNVTVWVFTVNTPMLARKLTALGVDGLITNHPAELGSGLIF